MRIKVDDIVIRFTKGGYPKLAPLKEGWDYDIRDLEDGWLHPLTTNQKNVEYILHVHNKSRVTVLFLETQEWNIDKSGEWETTCLEPLAAVICYNHHREATIFKDSYFFLVDDEYEDKDDDDSDFDELERIDNELIELYKDLKELIAIGPDPELGYDRSFEAELSRLEDKIDQLEYLIDQREAR